MRFIVPGLHPKRSFHVFKHKSHTAITYILTTVRACNPYARTFSIQKEERM